MRERLRERERERERDVELSFKRNDGCLGTLQFSNYQEEERERKRKREIKRKRESVWGRERVCVWEKEGERDVELLFKSNDGSLGTLQLSNNQCFMTFKVFFQLNQINLWI